VVTISVSVLPNRARLRFMSFRTFSTFNISHLALPSLKKVSVREVPVGDCAEFETTRLLTDG